MTSFVPVTWTISVDTTSKTLSRDLLLFLSLDLFASKELIFASSASLEAPRSAWQWGFMRHCLGGKRPDMIPSAETVWHCSEWQWVRRGEGSGRGKWREWKRLRQEIKEKAKPLPLAAFLHGSLISNEWMAFQRNKEIVVYGIFKKLSPWYILLTLKLLNLFFLQITFIIMSKDCKSLKPRYGPVQWRQKSLETSEEASRWAYLHTTAVNREDGSPLHKQHHTQLRNRPQLRQASAPSSQLCFNRMIVAHFKSPLNTQVLSRRERSDYHSHTHIQTHTHTHTDTTSGSGSWRGLNYVLKLNFLWYLSQI